MSKIKSKSKNKIKSKNEIKSKRKNLASSIEDPESSNESYFEFYNPKTVVQKFNISYVAA